jgi:hypothetical protein
MHNLFLVYFVNLYMFREYLGPSTGGTTLCIQQMVFIIIFRWLSVVQVGLELVPIQVVHQVGFSSHDSSWVSQLPNPHADQLPTLGKAALPPHHQIRTSAASVHTLICKPFFQHTHTDHHRASDPTCNIRLFLSQLSPYQDKFVNDFVSVTYYFVTAVVLSFLGTLYGDTGWIGVVYNRMATNELVVTLVVIGSSFGSVPLPHQTRDIRLRCRRTNFAYQNRRRKLSGTRNGSNATAYSLMHKWLIF